MSFNYIGPINTTGYGVASAGYLSALLKLDNTIGFKPVGQIQGSIADELKPAIERFDPSKPSFCFWHLFDIPNQMKECTGKKVGMTTFEIDQLKQPDVAALEQLDEVCTASVWGRNVLAKYTQKPTHIIPHAMKQKDDDTLPKIGKEEKLLEVWEKALAPLKLDPDTLILSTAGKYESRKGHPELIDACIELGKEKPVLLISFLYNPFIHDNFPYGFINSRFMYPVHTKSGIKVFNRGKFNLVLMPPTRERHELHAALSKADYFVSPSKGEGWNLPLFEMMSYGMPCIASLNTAHKDYASSDSCIVVNSDPDILYAKAWDGQFFDGSGRWYNITKETIEGTILRAIEMKGSPELDVMGEEARKLTSKFSWQKSAKMILNLMKTN